MIDAKTYSGRVERRDKGGWFETDERLYVGGRDRTSKVASMAKQLAVVQRSLGEIRVSVHGALCFVDAEWGIFTKPFQIGGVWITHGHHLSQMIGAEGLLYSHEVLRIADTLATALPPKMN